MQRNEDPAPRSITALAVAHAVLMCAKSKEWSHLVDPTLALLSEYFFKSLMKLYPVNKGWMLYSSINLFSYDFQRKIFETIGVIGFPQHAAMRKMLIEQQVRKAIAQGVQQVIILGSGYDTLALRLHSQFPAVQFFELDRGQTHTAKIALIESFKNPANNPILVNLMRSDPRFNEITNRFKNIGPNLHFINCDLNRPDWQHTLYRCEQFNRNNTSIAIMEGFTFYFTLEENTAVLQTLKDFILNKQSRIILSFRESNATVTDIKGVVSVASEAKETFLCELNTAQFLEFANKMQMAVTGKMLGADIQRLSGNGLAVIGDNPRGLITENYYLMDMDFNRANSNLIQEIPDIAIDVPVKPAKLPEASPSCSIV